MEVDWQARYNDVRDQLNLANAKLEKDPFKVGYYREMKISRQRNALHNLNRRVRVQRLQLRKLNEMERGLRPEEWQALKEEFASELAEDEWDAYQ